MTEKEFSRLVKRMITNNIFNPQIRVMLFDFDGTLVNTTPLILRSFRATWAKFFGFTLDDRTFIKTFGMLIHTAIKQLIELSAANGQIALPNDLNAEAEEVLHVYRAFNLKWHDEMIEPFPNIVEVLEELRLRHLRLGVVSSKIRKGVEHGLNLFQMAELFDVIIGAEDVDNHKPHPEPLLKAMERLEAMPRETIFIGDSTHDIVAGRAAQMLTAAATWGPFQREDLESLLPDYLLDEPSEILTMVKL